MGGEEDDLWMRLRHEGAGQEEGCKEEEIGGWKEGMGRMTAQMVSFIFFAFSFHFYFFPSLSSFVAL